MRDIDLYRTAIRAIIGRMDEISAQCGDRFPLFRVETEERWTLSRRGSWLGGFWAGLWWRRAAVTGSAADHALAGIWSERLQPMLQETSINRSFVFWYGAAIGDREFGGSQAVRRLAAQAVRSIAADFDTSLDGWSLGTGMGAGEAGARRFNVDALAPTLALLHGYGGPDGGKQAYRHLHSCLRCLARNDGAWAANARVNADGSVHRDEAGVWPRGQAWAMLGMAEAVRLYGARYRDAALQACVYWRRRWGEACPGTTATAPRDASRDLSSQAISAVAMLELYRLLPDQHWLHRQAQAQLDALLMDGGVAENGRFAGQLYRTGPGEERRVESACGTYFLLEALLIVSSVSRSP